MKTLESLQLQARGRLPAFLVIVLAWLATADAARAVTFTEIFYDPPAASQDKARLKFIEIFNDSPTAVDLAGFHFAEGVIFTFPPKTILGGKDYLVICADQDLIKSTYGIQNVIGNFEGTLSEDGDELVLLTEGGGIAARVDFRDRGRWTSVPRGTGYSLSLKEPYADPRRPENWTSSSRPGGTPGDENFPPPRIVETEIFGEVSDWRYQKGWNGTAMAAFSTPADAWRKKDFEDSGWLAGNTGIGYGGTDDQTVLSDMNGNYLAFATRKRFNIASEVHAELQSLILRVRVDDGFVAYLNGEEIGRINLGSDPEVPFDKAATTSRSGNSPAIVITVPREKVLAGENVLAVEVHNQSLGGSSGDTSFLPSMGWTRIEIDEGPPPVTVRINEVLREPGPAGGERWVELYNTSDSTVPLAGFTLRVDPRSSSGYVFPDGKSLQGSGRMTLSETELGFSLAGTGVTRELRLYLFQADGATVADAAILETATLTRDIAASQARLPDGGPEWLISTQPTPGASNVVPIETGIVINEIMYHPLSTPVLTLPDGEDLEQGEYIELHNRSDHTISLAGWALTKGYNFFFPAGAQIPSGGYLVVGPDREYLKTTYSLSDAVVLGPVATPKAMADFGSLSNNGESVRLEDSLGNPVDEVTFAEGGEWSGLADFGGSSLELIDPAQDNSVGSAWEASDETGSAQWTQYTYTANASSSRESEFWLYLMDEGECLIDDVTVEVNDVQYIPNGGFESASLPPWRVDGTHIRSRRTTEGVHSGTGCLHIIASGGGDNRVNHIELDTNPRLNSGSATVTFWARWLKGSRRIHSSLYNNNSLAMDHVLEIPPNLGTPGAENRARQKLRTSTGSDNLGPVASEVRHTPAVPPASTPVTVLARLSDSDGVKDPQVEFRLGRKSTAVTTAPMFDDGAHGDGEAGDGLYGGIIPAQPLNVKVLFNVVATDGGGRIRRFPAEAPERTLLYQVSDPVDSHLLRYRLILDDENQQVLTTRRLHSDDLLDGSFVFEEKEVYYNVGARYHGSPWNRPPDPKMWRIRFRDDKPMRGSSRINVSRYGSAPNEGTAYQLLRQASGGPAARTTYSPRYDYIRFYYNGRASTSSAMAEIIPPDGDYFNANFPQDSDGFAYKLTGKLEFDDGGNFIDGAVSWTALRVYGPTKENFRYFYNPGTREMDDNFDPVIKFTTMLDAAKTPLAKLENPTEGLESICNVDAFLRVLAVRVLQDDWDTVGIGNGQNAYLYFAPKEGRVYLLPWDMDHTFGNTGAIAGPNELGVDPGVRRMLNDSPKYRRAYLRIMKEILGTFWSAQQMSPWLDAVAADAKNMVGSPAGIKSFMTSRINIVRGKMPQLTRNVKFAITNPAGGRDLAVKAREATISGTAPLEIARIEISRDSEDPLMIEPVWQASSTDFKLTLALAPGEPKSTFKLFGLSAHDELVGEVLKITIYDSTGWTAPVAQSIEPNHGPLDGGTQVLIHGEAFQGGAAVAFGAAQATVVEVVSTQLIRATTPVGAGLGTVDVTVTNLDSQSSSLPAAYTFETAAKTFIRGDADGNLAIDISDPIYVIGYQFLAGPAPVCLQSADADDSGTIEINDPILIINYLFNAGAPPQAPFPEAGVDTSADPLDC